MLMRPLPPGTGLLAHSGHTETLAPNLRKFYPAAAITGSTVARPATAHPQAPKKAPGRCLRRQDLRGQVADGQAVARRRISWTIRCG